MNFGLLISIDVLEFVERLPEQVANEIRSAIKAIGRDPLGVSDASDHDEIGRRLEIAIVGDYALMYWVDDADRQVKILDIHAADR